MRKDSCNRKAKDMRATHTSEKTNEERQEEKMVAVDHQLVNESDGEENTSQIEVEDEGQKVKVIEKVDQEPEEDGTFLAEQIVLSKDEKENGFELPEEVIVAIEGDKEDIAVAEEVIKFFDFGKIKMNKDEF